MRKTCRYALVAAAVVVLVGGALPARSTETPAQETKLLIAKEYVPVLIQGKRARRIERIERWVNSLSGDRLSVYQALGAPTGKHFERKLGETTEVWTYLELGRTFVFKGDTLSKTIAFTTWK